MPPAVLRLTTQLIAVNVVPRNGEPCLPLKLQLKRGYADWQDLGTLSCNPPPGPYTCFFEWYVTQAPTTYAICKLRAVAPGNFSLESNSFAIHEGGIGPKPPLPLEPAGAQARTYAYELHQPTLLTGSSSIVFSLPAETRVTLTVHDLRGRRVAVLQDGPAAAGMHEVRWDGTSGAGLRLPAGLYLLKLESPLGTRSSKVILVQ